MRGQPLLQLTHDPAIALGRSARCRLGHWRPAVAANEIMNAGPSRGLPVIGAVIIATAVVDQPVQGLAVRPCRFNQSAMVSRSSARNAGSSELSADGMANAGRPSCPAVAGTAPSVPQSAGTVPARPGQCRIAATGLPATGRE